MNSSPLDLAQGLIRCPSITPVEGGALAGAGAHSYSKGDATKGATAAG